MDFYTIQVIAHQDVPSWVSFLNHNRVSRRRDIPNNLIVDFANVSEILPYHIVSLACLIEEYHLCGIKIVFFSTEKREIQYLSQLDFFQYWTSNINRREYRVCEDGTSYCLWQVEKEMFLSYVSHAHQYFQGQYFQGRDLIPLHQSLVELFNNVMDHAQSNVSAYVTTKFYPERNKFIISLCDFGKSIPGTVNEYMLKNGRFMIGDLEAMDLAFQEKFTVQSRTNNGGLGLDYVLSVTKTLKGELVVISKHAHVSINSLYENDFKRKHLPEPFPGTLVVVTINTQNLNRLNIDENNIFH